MILWIERVAAFGNIAWFFGLAGARMVSLPALVLLVASGCGRSESPALPPLIVVSFDGFRNDYIDREPARNLRAFAKGGVKAEGLIPVFPTMTFPNHYTVVTGLYPDHHGIVSNNMVDPETAASFSLDNREAVKQSFWWGGEPIWVTAEKRGLKTAPLLWPGSEAAIGGVRPAYWQPFVKRSPPRERVDQLLDLLDLPEGDRPVFLTLYFSATDSAGHRYGPASAEVDEAIGTVDQMLGRLLAGLDERGLRETVNVIVLSDHGMAEVSPDNVIRLTDFVDLSCCRVVDDGGFLGLIPGPALTEDVYRRLSDVHPKLQIFRKDALPQHLHYGSHRRVPPLVGLVEAGWEVKGQASGTSPYRGEHGYDPSSRLMHGVFVAAGPAFQQGLVVDSVHNLDLYELMAHLLQLEPAPNDGSFERVRRLLKNP